MTDDAADPTPDTICRSLVLSVRVGGGGVSGHQGYKHYTMRDTVDFDVHFTATLFKQQVTQNQNPLSQIQQVTLTMAQTVVIAVPTKCVSRS